MKKLILTIIIAAAGNALLAQCKEDKTIRTNPSNPANTELNPLIPSGGVNLKFFQSFKLWKSYNRRPDKMLKKN